MANTKIDWNDRAFAEISKSPEMQAYLGECAKQIADGANANAMHYEKELHAKKFKKAPFVSGSKVLKGTAIGYAYPAHAAGRFMQAAHKCLSKQVH